MLGKVHLALTAFAALLALGGAAHAQPVTPNKNAEASVNIRRPFSLLKLSDLDFATVASSNLPGTARINANSGAMTTSGGVVFAGGSAKRAKWRVTTLLPTIIRIRLPATATVLTRIGGTETMTASNFTQDGPALRIILLPGTLDFHVGAQLNVGAAQAEGTYVGNFSIEVDHL